MVRKENPNEESKFYRASVNAARDMINGIIELLDIHFACLHTFLGPNSWPMPILEYIQHLVEDRLDENEFDESKKVGVPNGNQDIYQSIADLYKKALNGFSHSLMKAEIPNG
jgi:hypothetical protein